MYLYILPAQFFMVKFLKLHSGVWVKTQACQFWSHLDIIWPHLKVCKNLRFLLKLPLLLPKTPNFNHVNDGQIMSKCEKNGVHLDFDQNLTVVFEALFWKILGRPIIHLLLKIGWYRPELSVVKMNQPIVHISKPRPYRHSSIVHSVPQKQHTRLRKIA